MVDIYFTLDNFSLSQGSDFSGKRYRQVLIANCNGYLDWMFCRAGLANELYLKMACPDGEGTMGWHVRMGVSDF